MADSSVLCPENRFQEGLQCPHCDGKQINKYGSDSNGTQRYRCKACDRTFNQRTGTPLASLQKPELFQGFLACMQQGLSCRKAAARLDVDHKTIFRWRHKVLKALGKQPHPRLKGIVEADEIYFRRSFKGQEVVGRSSRERGSDASKRGLGKDKVPVLVALNRNGNIVSHVLDSLSTSALLEHLGPVLDPRAKLCSDGSRPMQGFARRKDLDHHAFRASQNERGDGLYHLQHVNAYHQRLRGWMGQFRGVSTKYLSHYLAWHVILEKQQDLRPKAALQQWLGRSVTLPDPEEHRCPNCGYPQAA